MVQVGLPPVPVHLDGVPAFVFLEADMQRLVHVADEVRKKHEALRQVICVAQREANIQKSPCLFRQCN
jgi:hypothetical protein